MIKKFIYQKGITQVDDIIEHILMRLNTDFAGGCLQVPDFCKEEHYYDTIMEMKIREKMYQHNVAKRCDGKGQPDTAIALTAKGAEVYENGGWKQYLVDFKNQEAEKRNQASQANKIINIGGNVTGSNIGHDSDFRFAMKSKKAIKQIPIETPKKKSNQDIWEKLKSVAQILGFMAALIALITKLMDLW